MLVSFSALLVVLLGFSRMLLSSRMAAHTTHESTLAKEAARGWIERLQATAFDQVYPTYGAAGGAADFDVPGLEAPLDDADGLPGEILFPESGGVLSELCDRPQYGWPVDMDGDGLLVSADVSATHRLLPVVVRVAWRGAGGDGVLEFQTVIAP
jgi:hypothetical protein